MPSSDPYNQIVRTAFSNSVHAGDLTGSPEHALRASVAESADGAQIELAAGIAAGDAGDVIVEMRFRAWGCPHLIAAAETLCKELEGAKVANLSEFDFAAKLALLAVPVEKTGRILLLEGALNSLRAQYSEAYQSAIVSDSKDTYGNYLDGTRRGAGQELSKEPR